MNTLELPTKDKKIQQENFKTYRESQDWLKKNGYKFIGYLDEPWTIFFVERWEKEDTVALAMDISVFWNKLSIKMMETPYQVDIATK